MRWPALRERVDGEPPAPKGKGFPRSPAISIGGMPGPVAPGAEAEYYKQWLEALETLLTEKGLLFGEELETRTAEFAAGLWDHEH